MMMMAAAGPVGLKAIVLKGVISVAAIGGGIYLYHRYKNEKRRMVGMTAGMLAGHKIGAAVGGMVGGPMGAMTGMTIGCLSGCMVGGTLAEPDATSCCDESEVPIKKTA